jgi:DNA ligase D-like protein (predicted 3'-phosphoesterase)
VIVGKAHELSVMGWVRSESDGSVRIHAEGTPEALAELISFLHDRGSPGEIAVEVESVAHEGHEQFAIRGVSAGAFVIQEHVASTHHFDLRLEVDGVMRSWAVPKGPSLDPAVKRFAVEASDHAPADNAFEGKRGAGAVIVWDQGTYEQGGRVPWPEALKRGHAVFVLHGQKLRGGFALQRTRPGPKAGWLLVKRRDDEARAGSDIVAERPDSVVSGHTLADVQS